MLVTKKQDAFESSSPQFKAFTANPERVLALRGVTVGIKASLTNPLKNALIKNVGLVLVESWFHVEFNQGIPLNTTV